MFAGRSANDGAEAERAGSVVGPLRTFAPLRRPFGRKDSDGLIAGGQGGRSSRGGLRAVESVDALEQQEDSVASSR